MTDILIRGVNIPQNCIDCLCYNTEFGYCQATEDDIESSFYPKPVNCPLDELPKHGDLIERNPLVKLFNSRETDEHWGWLDEEDLINAPVIVPANKEETE